MSYLKNLQSLAGQITAANGTTIIVTAEPVVHLPASRSASGYDGLAIVDPGNILAAELNKRGVLQLAISNKSGYVDGMAQPAILVLQKDGTVLYDWAITPGLVSLSYPLLNTCARENFLLTTQLTNQMNLHGAKDRPVLKEVWENVAAGLDHRPLVHQRYSKTSITSVMCGKLFG